MFRNLLIAVLMLPLFAASSGAVGLPVAKGLVFALDPVGGWTVHSADPPEALVKETARHVAHEPAAAKATPEQIEIVARKRLASNEAIVYHPSSGAHLNIDFSPLDEGASAPNSRTLKKSAEYAARSLANENDVTDAIWDIRAVKFDGASDTYLLSVKFLRHGAPMVFQGYVGTVQRHWFFLYFTAPGDDLQVLQEMESMLANASIRIVEP